MSNILDNNNISNDINNFSKYFQKSAWRIEKSCTFAPAELNEGLPLKMI